MASLSNINGLFDVHSTGAILFSTSHGTSGQILRSNGNAAPTWVAASTVIGGPYLPLTGGTLTGPLSGTSATFSGNVACGNPAGTNTGVRIYYGAGTGSYGSIRFYSNAINTNTIHVFSDTWQSGTIFTKSSGAINIDGNTGVTFGAWNLVDVAFKSGGPNYFRSNVGIGTTSPTHLLTLEKTDTNSVQLVIDNNNTSDAGTETSKIRFRHYRSYVAGLNDAGEITVGKEQAWDAAGDRNSYMSFGTRKGSDGVVEKMRIDSSGKILLNRSTYNFIGTNTSDAADNQRMILAGGGEASPSRGAQLQLYGNEYTGQGGNASLITGGTGYITFLTGSTITERMRIDSSGKVSIGNVTTDVATLTVQGGLAGIIDVWRSGTGASYQAIRFRDATNANTEASIGYGGNQLRLNAEDNIVLTTASTEKMRIDSLGNVGIGTINPTSLLTVNNGNIKIVKSMLSGGTDFDFLQLSFNGGWSGNIGGLAAINFTDSITATNTVGRIGVTYTGSQGKFVVTDLYSGGYAASGDVFTIQADGKTYIKGNVGIGTTAPSQPLDVNGYSICDKQFQRDNTLQTILNTPRVLNIGYRGANGTYTFNPVALFGNDYRGGQVLLECTGWRMAMNNGYIMWRNAGGSNPIGTSGAVSYVQTAYSAGGQSGSNTIAVSTNSGTNNITIQFTGWHSNAHGWNCKIISYQA